MVVKKKNGHKKGIFPMPRKSEYLQQSKAMTLFQIVMKVSSSLRQRKGSLMTLQIIYTSKCPGYQNSLSQSFTLLKESEANMDCSEEPLETNTANEF